MSLSIGVFLYMVPKNLAAAIAIAKDLGWHQAAVEELDTYDLGTPQQQRTIKEGLSSGQWEYKAAVPDAVTIDYLEGIDRYRMVLLAIRVQVPARRALRLLRSCDMYEYRRIAKLVAANGEHYARSFIKEAARVAGGVNWPDQAVGYNVASFFLQTQYVQSHQILAEPYYLQAWAVCGLRVLQHNNDIANPRAEQFPTWEEMEPTFTKHLKVAFETEMPIWGTVGEIAIEALDRQLIDRDSVIIAALKTLKRKIRLNQRQQMIDLIDNELAITDEEILAHWEFLRCIADAANPDFISAFGSRMIRLADFRGLAEVALSALYVPTVKEKQVILKTLLDRDDNAAPAAGALSERIRELAGHKDKELAQLAKTLLGRWGELGEASEPTAMPLVHWLPTPQIWQVPRFERGAATVAALQQRLASGALSQWVRTLEEEAFLAQLVQLAYEDTATAREFLADIGQQYSWLPRFGNYQDYKKGRKVRRRTRNAFADRRMQLTYTIGSLPCLLSEPSFMDFSISFTDLLDRLDQYEAANVAIIEPDLRLALNRLSTDDLDYNRALEQAYQRNAKADFRLSHEPKGTAGKIVADYLRRLFEKTASEELALRIKHGGVNEPGEASSAVLSSPVTPVPSATGKLSGSQVTTAPQWGESEWTSLRHHARARHDREGLLALQVARSKEPLEPGTAVNLIGLCRKTKYNAHDHAYQAVHLAWQRGILLPGIPDPKMLSWKADVTSFRGMSEVLVALAYEGMLALSWQLLDDFLLFAAKDNKNPPEAQEAVEAMKVLASSVTWAIDEGTAPQTAANVPGLRAFAAKPDITKAAVIAKDVLKLLPDLSGEV